MLMVNETLKNHFDRGANSYDRQRQDVIPYLDQMYNIIVDLTHSELSGPKILDLGAGTGLLTQYIFKKYSKGYYTLIDISKEMLNNARERFDGQHNFNYIHGDYLKADFEDSYDIVVSSLSIHHLEDIEKKILYSKVYEVLNDGGIFINADQVIAPNPENEYIYQRNWWEKIEKGSLTQNEKQTIIGRMKLDKPASLESNLKWLESCGFVNVDVFYKYYNFCIIYGKK
jgi:tRNA (cmo5U34)-methyltransferase